MRHSGSLLYRRLLLVAASLALLLASCATQRRADAALSAESAPDAIRSLPDTGSVHAIAIEGDVNFRALIEALKSHNGTDVRVALDLSGVTNLEAIPTGYAEVAGWRSFANLDCLASLVLPDVTREIGSDAFSDCRNLKEVTIGAGVTEIGRTIFYGCGSIQRVTVSRGNSAYSAQGGVLFSRDKKRLVCFPRHHTGTSYAVPRGTEEIEDRAFYDCPDLECVTFPKSLRRIGRWAFGNCASLKSVRLEGSVEELGGWAFASCTSLEEVVIAGQIREIPESAFISCSALDTVTFGVGVKRICEWAFDGCTSLATVIYDGGVSEFNAINIAPHNEALFNAHIIFRP